MSASENHHRHSPSCCSPALLWEMGHFTGVFPFFCSHGQLQSFYHLAGMSCSPLRLRSQGPHPLSCLQLGNAVLSGPRTRWGPLPGLCVPVTCNLPDCGLRVRAQAGTARLPRLPALAPTFTCASHPQACGFALWLRSLVTG